MSEIFRIPSDRQPWLDPESGLISRPWFLFLQGIFSRLGNSTGGSATDDDLGPAQGNAEFEAQAMAALQSVGVAPLFQLQQQVESIESVLSSNNAELAELRRYVEGIAAGTII